MQAQLLGQPVKHSSFGKGVVTRIADNVITVDFPLGEKRFQYPEAFASFLTLKDGAKQAAINAQCREKQEEEAQERRAQREEEMQRIRISTMQIAPDAQAAFDVAAQDAARIVASGRISTGVYLSGRNRGKPRIPSRMKPHSACLLTGVPEGGKEKDRQILGAVMASPDFWGASCSDGVVEGHAQHRICLPEGGRLRYWDYAAHDGASPRWGRVPFKYFPNTVMKQILRDMAEQAAGTAQEAQRRAFYRYFCEINRLSE